MLIVQKLFSTSRYLIRICRIGAPIEDYIIDRHNRILIIVIIKFFQKFNLGRNKSGAAASRGATVMFNRKKKQFHTKFNQNLMINEDFTVFGRYERILLCIFLHFVSIF